MVEQELPNLLMWVRFLHLPPLSGYRCSVSCIKRGVVESFTSHTEYKSMATVQCSRVKHIDASSVL